MNNPMKTFYDHLIYFRAGGVEAVPKRYHVPQTGVLGAHSTRKTCFGPTCFQMDDLFERARRVLGAGTMEDILRENQRRRLTPSITQIVWLNKLADHRAVTVHLAITCRERRPRPKATLSRGCGR